MMEELVSMVESRGLMHFHYYDTHGGKWTEIRPSTATFRVPFFAYTTNLVRMIVDQHLSFWLEAVGHCVRSGSLRSLHAPPSLDRTLTIALLDAVDGALCVCQVHFPFQYNALCSSLSTSRNNFINN